MPRRLGEFEAWQAESPANAAAFERAKRAWDVFDDADGDPHLDALRESSLAVGRESRSGIWPAMGTGIAASLVAMLASNAELLSPSPRPPMRAVPVAERAVTAGGGSGRVDLAR